ncbi:argonaute 2-like protein [Tanacetum coccineum]
MEQNSYNRGGYRGGRSNRGGGRGGQDGGNGGRVNGGGGYPRGGGNGGGRGGYAVAQDGGYGNNSGRGNGGGYGYGGQDGGNGGGGYPRGGGRGNSQQYDQYGGRGGRGNGGYVPRGGGRGNNQQYGQQEGYGGRGRGRGGDRGGRDGGAYRQNVDRDNYGSSGDHRDLRNGSGVVGSGQLPAQTSSLTSSLAGRAWFIARNDNGKGKRNTKEYLQIQEPNVSSPPSPVADQGNAYVPIQRPDHGGTHASSRVKLLVNHFPVKFSPSTSVLRYDVDVKKAINPEASSAAAKSAKKPIPKSDLRMIQEKLSSEYPNQFPLLQTAYDGEKNIYSAVELPSGTYNVELFGRSYTCTIKYGTELNLSKLQDFLAGNAAQLPRDVLQALDVVMKANLFREKVSVGRGMYPREYRNEDDLFNCGVAAYRGSQQSIKITSKGLVLCSDYSAIPFRKRMPVIDYLKEYIREIKQVSDIAQNGNYVMAALKGLRVSVTHRRTNQKYIVAGLTEQLTRDISFQLEDLEGNNPPENVMLTEYFRQKWNKEIVHTNIPCLKLGNSNKPNYVPMEYCFLADDHRYPKEELGKEAQRKLRDLSLLAPEVRRREISNMVHQEYATGRNGAEVINNFDLEVGMEMTEVDGRVMAPPRLKLGSLSGNMNITTVDRQKCHWNLLQGKTLVTGKTLERWALIDFSGRLNADLFIPKLINRCKSLGIQMEEPVLVHWSNTRELSDGVKIDRVLSKVVEDSRRKSNGQLQMIICVMAAQHPGYKHLKWVSETKIGVITQCCLSPNANKANDQFLANLGMKINAKLGGSNVELLEQFPLFSSEDRYMFIGADVNHPAASNTLSPSVAAVVGSINWPAATRYAARVSPQKHRKEEIVNFGSLCLDLIKSYVKENGVRPNKIIVFRDGVSDGQFDMVLNKEMVDLKKTIYTEQYRPWITFVVAQKRHTTRLFPNSGRDVGNVPPGTVVDTTIVHPFEFDFYLCSHFGGIGTSKPTHYSVIWDENKFSSDEMQKLVYHLCYTFARCTKPVSLVPPVYYADLVAYRGRMFQEVAMEMESSGSAPSSFNQYFYNLEGNLKDSMFFI